jgi:hypothetical protein
LLVRAHRRKLARIVREPLVPAALAPQHHDHLPQHRHAGASYHAR